MSRIQKMFHNIDGDKSGEIDKQEFQRLYQKVGINLSGKELDNQFRMYDQDNSGTISMDELQKHVHVTHGSQGYDHDLHLRAVFNRFDENRDGHLDARELSELYRATGSHTSVQDAEQQIRINGFHNGRVNYEEFKRICSISHGHGHSHYTHGHHQPVSHHTTYATSQRYHH